MNTQDQYPDVLTAEVIGYSHQTPHGRVVSKTPLASDSEPLILQSVAAAEITRLRAELEQANRQIAARNTYLEAERDALKAEVEAARNSDVARFREYIVKCFECDRLTAECDALKAEVEGLRRNAANMLATAQYKADNIASVGAWTRENWIKLRAQAILEQGILDTKDSRHD